MPLDSSTRTLPVYGLDIETDTHVDGLDPAVAAVIAVAVADDHGVAVFTGAEPDLLVALDDHLCGCPPGIIATWNGCAFDLPFLAARAARHGIELALRLELDPLIVRHHPPLPGQDGAFRARWHHHAHLDGYLLYRNDVARLGFSCGLKTVARLAGVDIIEVDTAQLHLLSAATVGRYVVRRRRRSPLGHPTPPSRDGGDRSGRHRLTPDTIRSPAPSRVRGHRPPCFAHQIVPAVPHSEPLRPSDVLDPDHPLPSLDDLTRSLLGAPAGLYSLHRARPGWSTRRHIPAEVPDDLTGQLVPASWAGVAQVYRGLVVNSIPAEDASICVAHRRDGTAAVAVSAGIAPTGPHSSAPLDVVAGVIDDTGRRLLGLAGRAASCDLAEVSAWAWLDELWGALTSDDGPRYLASWDRLAAMHPGRDLVESASPDALAAGLAARCDRWSWHILRNAVAGEGVGDHVARPGWAPFSRPEVQLPAHHARWMDDAMYARHVTMYMPEPWWLLDAIGSLLPASVHTLVVETAARSAVATSRPS